MALEERDKKILMGVGIAAAVIVVLFLGKSLLFGGGEEEVDPGATAPTDTTATAPTDSGTATTPTTPPGDAVASPLPTGSTSINSFVFSDRDFFSPIPTPVIIDPSATPSASPTSSGGDSTPSELNIDGHVVKINDVIVRKTPSVDVSVDGVNYKAAIGDTFASDFTVTAIDTLTFCARFHWESNGSKGDQDDFTLCVP